MRFDPTVPPGNFRIRIRRYSETAAPPRMPSLRVSRRPLRLTQAPSPPPDWPAHCSGGAVRDLRARNHARATLGESRPVAPSAAPRWCPLPPRPHSTGPAPADAHSALGGLRVHRAVLLGPRGRQRAGALSASRPGAAARSGSVCVTVCMPAVFLVGTQQPDSFRTCGVGSRLDKADLCRDLSEFIDNFNIEKK